MLVTIPLFSVEITLGKATRKDPVGAYKALAPGTPWFLNGYLNVLTLILMLILRRGLKKGIELANSVMMPALLLILGALFMTLFVGWVWRIPNFARAAGITSKAVVFIWSFLVKYLIPMIIFMVWLNLLGINLEISRLFQ